MSDRRLPMPGEKPSTIWRPRREKPRHAPIRWPSLWRPLFLLAIAALLWLGLWAWRATSTSVTVVVDGEPVEVRTHRRTVAGAVRLAGVRLDETIYLEPHPETPLEGGMVITASRLRPVIVLADGQSFTASTRYTDPRAIVLSLGIPLADRDAVVVERALRPTAAEIAAQPALADVPAIPRQIRVARPQQVIVREVESLTGAEKIVSFDTTETLLGGALGAAGYTLYEADRIAPALGTPVTAGMQVTIERSTPVQLAAGGLTFNLRTHQRTVGDLFTELGLALNARDFSLPGPNAPITPGASIRLVRVHTEEQVEEQAISSETLYIPDPDLFLDQQRVVDPGEDGVLARRVRVRSEDGVVVSEAVTAQWTAQTPRPRIVAYGTHIVIQTLQTPSGPLQYWRHLRLLATSYSPLTAGDKQPGDPFFGLSATGAEVVRGIVATDPRVIPLGTWLYVPRYGSGRALDVGGAVKGMRIDLGYDDANLVLWNEWVDVYLLLPVPPPDQMVWVLPVNRDE